jgi:hypothetical protein
MKTATKILCWTLWTTLCLWPMAGAALADSTYDPLGIRTGGFTLYPSLTLGGKYNDNIYATRSNEEADWITTVTPALDVRSNWSRHALRLNTGLAGGFYASNSDENYLDAHVLVDGRLDVHRESYLTARAGFERLHEDRGDPDANAAWDEAAVYYRTSTGLAYHQGLNRFSVKAGADYEDLNYTSVDLRGGGSQNMDIRDRGLYDLHARLAYELLPDVQPFLATRYEWRRYDRADARRDSEGYRIGLGTGFRLSGVTSGEVFGGYMRQEYDHYDDISGFWYGMSLLWKATRLTTVEARAESAIKETLRAKSSGIDVTEAGLRVEHELLRNLRAAAFIDYARDAYEGEDITDHYTTIGPSLTYLWNRNLSARVDYRYRHKESNRSEREYDENIFGLSVTGAF